MLLQSQMPPEFWGAVVVLATDIYNCTPHRSLGMESPHYRRYGKQPDLSFFRAFGCAVVVHRGRDLVEHTKLAPQGELCVYLGIGKSHGRRAIIAYSPRTSRVYATLMLDLMKHTFLFARPINGCADKITHPLSSWSNCLFTMICQNPTVADIVERLQSTDVPCDTDWALHDLLQLPASFEEQHPLDLEAMRSGDAETSISGEPPYDTIGPAGSSDGALEGFQPDYKAQNTVLMCKMFINNRTS